MTSMPRLLPLLTLALLAGCAAEKPKPVLPRPEDRPALPTTPVPQPEAKRDWQDLPLTPGGWTYAQDNASFGSGEPGFVIRCERESREIRLIRRGTTTGNTMTVHTSYGIRTFPLSVLGDASGVYAAFQPGDPFLDTVAFSRGRFSIEVPGLPMLVIPAWPEPARVIEDCRA